MSLRPLYMHLSKSNQFKTEISPRRSWRDIREHVNLIQTHACTMTQHRCQLLPIQIQTSNLSACPVQMTPLRSDLGHVSPERRLSTLHSLMLIHSLCRYRSFRQHGLSLATAMTLSMYNTNTRHYWIHHTRWQVNTLMIALQCISLPVHSTAQRPAR